MESILKSLRLLKKITEFNLLKTKKENKDRFKPVRARSEERRVGKECSEP